MLIVSDCNDKDNAILNDVDILEDIEGEKSSIASHDNISSSVFSSKLGELFFNVYLCGNLSIVSKNHIILIKVNNVIFRYQNRN